MTLSGIPSQQKSNTNANRRETLLPPTPTGGVQRRAVPSGRKSMIPRFGAENIPTSPENKNTAGGPKDNGAERRRKSIVKHKDSEVPPRKDRRKSLVQVGGFPAGTSSGIVSKHDNDPRAAIENKATQQTNMRNLLDFLVSNGYQYPVSLKSLSRPSSKEFYNIITFMLRMVDMNFQHESTMKFEDEVALNFKCLGYPCTISKTALVAAGSAHTWNSLFAALIWLMERLNSKMLVPDEDFLFYPNGIEFQTIEELTAKSEIAFYQFLGKGYSAFLTENAQELERVESALADRFLKDDESLERSIERITDVNTSYATRIGELESESLE